MNNAMNHSAIIDAQHTQESILKQCDEAGQTPPPYVLRELIGKGSFGRVYKANATSSREVVAVKIISIEEGDTSDPRLADTTGDILKEVGTVKLLGESGAKNINKILDTFVLGDSVWMVTQCAAGSVATLMKPTGHLPEKWAVPILREVAEAIYWVHQYDIIHRDIKCANVLVTEDGGVQLCDFGVAGILESKFDKRRTMIGTLHWMAPELFDPAASYGKEVDIWAFGAMAYELASGGPPNSTRRIDQDFGSYLKHNCPRLNGDQYSTGLKDLIAFCMVEDPRRRPTIAQVQKHSYVFSTSDAFPTTSLSNLVSAYKLWEAHGGVRQSLFAAAGAQGVLDQPSAHEDWDFSEDEFDTNAGRPRFEQYSEDEIVQILRDVYGIGPPTTTPSGPARRRRQPPKTANLETPLQKVFDPDTVTSYQENAHSFYHGHRSPPLSDLPLRSQFETPPVRESLIDLDQALDGIQLGADMETIKPAPRSSGFTALSNRKTLEWTFPKSDLSLANVSTATTFTEQSSLPGGWDSHTSCASLIDLDASLVIDQPTRPSTSGSTNTASSDEEFNAFALEDETSIEDKASRSPAPNTREPSIYVTAESATPSHQESVHDHVPPSPVAQQELRDDYPPLPSPPSARVMVGTADQSEVEWRTN